MVIAKESNDTDSSPAGPYPWPYIREYFKFLGCRGEASLEFQCLICKPVINKLSVNCRSHFNSKKHVQSVHPQSKEAVLKCFFEGPKVAKERKRTDYDNAKASNAT